MDITLDNISVGVIAQILPLLSIFGQDLTNSFLSQTIDWFDYVIFAVGPLGVIWVLSAAIRVLGLEFLRTKIGRGSEDEALVEKDLMTSTSPNVCELWNGEQVDRIVGVPHIQEFLLLGDEIWKSEDGKQRFFHYDGSRQELKKIDDLEKQHPPTTEPPLISGTRIELHPPNLSLNLSPPNRRRNGFIFTVSACCLQAGFFVLVTMMKFFNPLSNKFPLFNYSFYCTVIGTALLLSGLILCAHQISSASVKLSWKPLTVCPKNPLIVWVQRGLEEDNHTYSSYIIINKIKDEILESHHKLSFKRSQKTAALCIAIVLAIGGGYVIQVVGVSGMHYPTQITLFGITLMMTALRVKLRPKPQPLCAKKTYKHHEMDWLALAWHLHQKALIDDTEASKRAPTWTINGGQDWVSVGNLGKTPIGAAGTVNNPTTPSRTKGLLNLRTRIGEYCHWTTPASEKGHAVTQAIQRFANAMEEKGLVAGTEIRWRIPVDLGVGRMTEYLEFSIQKNVQSNSWDLGEDCSENYIVAALSLWLFYNKDTKYQRYNTGNSMIFLGPSAVRTELQQFWPADSPRCFRRLSFVKKIDKSPFDVRGPAEVAIERNCLVGFQNQFKMEAPSYFYDRYKSTIQRDVPSQNCQLCFETHPRDAIGDDLLPAINEVIDMPSLCAQHFFYAFMWAFLDHLKTVGLPPDASQAKHLNHFWQHCSEKVPDQREFLVGVAKHVSVTGLCDWEMALLMILTPIIHKKSVSSRS